MCHCTWLCVLLATPCHSRTWTDTTGRKVEAEYAGMQGDSVLLKLAPDKTVPYPLTRLCAEDQAFIKQQQGGAAVPAGAAAAVVRLPVEKRTWPVDIEVPSRSIEIAPVKENPAERQYVYQSEAFEFTSQAKLAGSVMKEVARTFEATRSLVDALPWGIVCRPPDGRKRFLAALYETRADYVQAGGPQMSGGVYNSGDKIFKIPFESLGLVKRGQTYFKSDFSSDTLVHEITHQMMDEYLGFLPTWVVEGTAEYTELLPYKAGIFRADNHKSALKENVDLHQQQGVSTEMGKASPLEQHMTMNRESWSQISSSSTAMRQLYHDSKLLVYFFCHLDGDKKGTRFMRFMDAVHGEVEELRAFFADPRVKRMEGGRFTYPSDMKLPDMKAETAPFKHLPILLGERSYEKISAEIIEGYKSIGIKIAP